MTISTIDQPKDNYDDPEQSLCEYYKSFTNYISALCMIHSDRVFARYCSNGKYKTLSYADIDRISINLACEWAPSVQGIEVVSIMSDHSFSYMVVMMALLKLRVTTLAISPRNSEAAIVNLLEKTQSKLLITNMKYESICKSSATQVDGVKVITVKSLDMETMSQKPLNANFEKILDLNFTEKDIMKSALIIHSSGSTALPKPIYLSNRYLFRATRGLYILTSSSERVGYFNENDTILSCVPLFHIFGFFMCFSMTPFGGSVVFTERFPPSQEEINQAIKINKVTIMSTPPIILEQMIPYLQEKNDFSIADHLKIVLFGGASLKQESGEWLQSRGINVRNSLGSTETGFTMCSDISFKTKDWNSMRPYAKDAQGVPYAIFETIDESQSNIKHLYIRVDSPALASNVSNRPDGGFDTNDLFIEHPDYPGYYTYFGRRDDILVMVNGEKTNPIPMESTIRESPVVKQVVILGQRRQCTAALIELDSEYTMKLNREEIIASVHKAVDKANSDCPNYSVIVPQMIWILPSHRTLPSTDKGTVMRKKVAVEYADVIDKLYNDFIEGPSCNVSECSTDVSTWSDEQVENFLVNCVANVLQISTYDLKNHSQVIFDFGFNSLSVIQLRNLISEYFPEVSYDFLYENPSITLMREGLVNRRKEDDSEKIGKRYKHTQDIALAYIQKADIDFPVAQNCYNEKRNMVVLLTGATGSLGSFMLRDMLKDKRITKVYCCVRGDKEKLHTRLVESFKYRSLDVSLLDTDRVEALPMDFNESFLGFTEELYNQLKEEVTIVQHCGWLLDFNMPIEYFDRECIAPFYSLLKFAYRKINPMHVHFISSVSASALLGDEIPEEPLPFDAHVSLPMGYAQSKFVVEILINHLTINKNFPCYIERLGQVCGDSDNGVWNTSEAYPLIFIGGGSIMRKMPNLDISVDWIPVNNASTTIVDIMLQAAYLPADKNQFVYNIVNPNRLAWSDILQTMRDCGMQFDTVSPFEWLESLSKDKTNPAYRLVSFYEDYFNEAKKQIWKTGKNSAITPVINQSPALDAKLFNKFLVHWKYIGFYAEDSQKIR